jgi:hypothetical protein
MCDCGWSFVEGRLTAPPRQPARDDHALRRKRRLLGAGQLVFGGLLVLGCVGAETARHDHHHDHDSMSDRAAPSSLPHDSAYLVGQGLVRIFTPIAGVILIIRGAAKLGR